MKVLKWCMACLLTMHFSCGTDPAEKRDTRIVAVAGSSELDIDTYRASFISSAFVKDSLYNSKRSIERWATEALLYQEATEKLSAEEIAVDKEVEAYRRTLVNYIYQSRLIEANLDTVISAESIAEYYNAHRENFILRENILKVNYIKVPLMAPGLEKIRRLTGSVNPKEVEQLRLLCIQNAENFFMNDSTWLFLDDIRKEIPRLKDEPDFNLSPGRVVEFSDEQYYYYLKVKDLKVKNAMSPLNFEKQNIRKFILNERKTQLLSDYNKLLLEKAKEQGKFIVY